MANPSGGDRPPARREGLASRLPWRYGLTGRRHPAAAAAGQVRAARGKAGAKGDGGSGDIDDHIRLAVREESAASLGRAGGRLQSAVAALAAVDRSADADSRRDRPALLQEATRVLWEYVVQREAMGLTDHRLVSQIYGVTPELWRRMGCFHPVDASGSPDPVGGSAAKAR